MKKQYYIDMWLAAGLTLEQIEDILCKVIQISREDLFVLKDISSKHIYDVQQVIYQMSLGELQEYSLEQANFYGRDFFVDARVLIPRNDTEVLVEHATRHMLSQGNIADTTYIDVGTGSGCIAASMVLELRPLRFQKSYAVDISPDALEVARHNCESLWVEDIELRESHLLDIFWKEHLATQRVCITANLPYIREGDTQHMDAEVYDQEPHLALFGGSETGFELYESLVKQVFQLKHIFNLHHIDMFLEIGFDQREVSESFFEELGLLFEYFPDSASIDRVVHVHGF